MRRFNMGPQSEDYIETVLTCEGNFYDPNFHIQLENFSKKLEDLIVKGSKKKPIVLEKVEPWNSVRVTLKIPKEAAFQLRCMAEHNSRALRDIGILSVQMEEGNHKISLKLKGRNNETTEVVLKTEPESNAQLLTANDTQLPPNRSKKKEKVRAGGAASQSSSKQHRGVLETDAAFAKGLKPTISEITSNAEHTIVSMGLAISDADPYGNSVQMKLSESFPTPPASVSTPSSPGLKFPPGFHNTQMNNLHNNFSQIAQTSPFGNANSAMWRMLGGKNASNASPLLVNLLQSQNDPSAAHAHFSHFSLPSAKVSSAPPNQDGVSFDEPSPTPAKKRRKPRKKAEQGLKKAKSQQETESVIQSILNQAISGIQDGQLNQVPISNFSFPPMPQGVGSFPSSSSVGSSYQAGADGHLKLSQSSAGTEHRQMINPTTGQLEPVEEEQWNSASASNFREPVYSHGMFMHPSGPVVSQMAGPSLHTLIHPPLPLPTVKSSPIGNSSDTSKSVTKDTHSGDLLAIISQNLPVTQPRLESNAYHSQATGIYQPSSSSIPRLAPSPPFSVRITCTSPSSTHYVTSAAKFDSTTNLGGALSSTNSSKSKASALVNCVISSSSTNELLTSRLGATATVCDSVLSINACQSESLSLTANPAHDNEFASRELTVSRPDFGRSSNMLLPTLQGASVTTESVGPQTPAQFSQTVSVTSISSVVSKTLATSSGCKPAVLDTSILTGSTIPGSTTESGGIHSHHSSESNSSELSNGCSGARGSVDSGLGDTTGEHQSPSASSGNDSPYVSGALRDSENSDKQTLLCGELPGALHYVPVTQMKGIPSSLSSETYVNNCLDSMQSSTSTISVVQVDSKLLGSGGQTEAESSTHASKSPNHTLLDSSEVPDLYVPDMDPTPNGAPGAVPDSVVLATTVLKELETAGTESDKLEERSSGVENEEELVKVNHLSKDTTNGDPADVDFDALPITCAKESLPECKTETLQHTETVEPTDCIQLTKSVQLTECSQLPQAQISPKVEILQDGVVHISPKNSSCAVSVAEPTLTDQKQSSSFKIPKANSSDHLEKLSNGPTLTNDTDLNYEETLANEVGELKKKAKHLKHSLDVITNGPLSISEDLEKVIVAIGEADLAPANPSKLPERRRSKSPVPQGISETVMCASDSVLPAKIVVANRQASAVETPPRLSVNSLPPSSIASRNSMASLPTPIMSTGIGLLQNQKTSTPGKESNLSDEHSSIMSSSTPVTLNSQPVKSGVSIMKPLLDREFQDDLEDIPSKESVHSKKNSKKEKEKQISANKSRTAFTVAQLLDRAEQRKLRKGSQSGSELSETDVSAQSSVCENEYQTEIEKTGESNDTVLESSRNPTGHVPNLEELAHLDFPVDIFSNVAATKSCNASETSSTSVLASFTTSPMKPLSVTITSSPSHSPTKTSKPVVDTFGTGAITKVLPLNVTVGTVPVSPIKIIACVDGSKPPASLQVIKSPDTKLKPNHIVKVGNSTEVFPHTKPQKENERLSNLTLSPSKNSVVQTSSLTSEMRKTSIVPNVTRQISTGQVSPGNLTVKIASSIASSPPTITGQDSTPALLLDLRSAVTQRSLVDPQYDEDSESLLDNLSPAVSPDSESLRNSTSAIDNNMKVFPNDTSVQSVTVVISQDGEAQDCSEALETTAVIESRVTDGLYDHGSDAEQESNPALPEIDWSSSKVNLDSYNLQQSLPADQEYHEESNDSIITSTDGNAKIPSVSVQELQKDGTLRATRSSKRKSSLVEEKETESNKVEQKLKIPRPLMAQRVHKSTCENKVLVREDESNAVSFESRNFKGDLWSTSEDNPDFKRTTRSTRSAEHCELPNYGPKKKQKT